MYPPEKAARGTERSSMFLNCSDICPIKSDFDRSMPSPPTPITIYFSLSESMAMLLSFFLGSVFPPVSSTNIAPCVLFTPSG